ncbi:FecR family protein [Persicobacter diffluens]|uniref:DUF4974 domain-containing protein n=1 Tax=Persicobacter diffluens TaxID=981 RepID=A0AAN5ANN2_9BACT|nr:hypothetical protein PEDI_35800 [Persicobacter diffluens]
MTGEHQYSEEKLIDYLKGRLSKAEEELLSKAREESGSLAEDLAVLEMIYSRKEELGLNINQYIRFNQINERIHQKEKAALNPQKGSAEISKKWAFGMAASLLLLLTFGLGSYHWWNEVPMIAVASQHEEIRELTLPDGSQLILYPNSEVRYPERFDEDIREIEFRGTGHFEVEANPEHPFSVVLANSEVRVLGTVFEVKAPVGGLEERVSLIEGVVNMRIDGNEKDLKLSPGESFRFDLPAGDFSVQPFDVQEVEARKQGSMLFHQTALQQVVADITDWYGIDIEVSDQLKNKRISGKFKTGSLSGMLQTLEVLSAGKIKKQQQRYLLE